MSVNKIVENNNIYFTEVFIIKMKYKMVLSLPKNAFN